MHIFIISIHIEKTHPAFPLAAAILKTSIQKNEKTAGQDVRILEYYLPLKTDEIASSLISEGADIICFSAYTWNSAEIIKLSTKLKTIKSDLRIMLGGPQASAATSYFTSTDLFDTIIKGEGEEAIIQALISENNETTIYNPSAIDIKSSHSPYPAISKHMTNREGILWEVSRGCPYSCSFCYEARGCKTIRSISSERMQTELKLFNYNRINKIWVLDPTFNHSSKHAEGVLEAILKYHPWAHYTFEIRAELMNKKLCEMFSQIDASLQIGLQTSTPASLQAINRSLSPKKFIEKCRMMSDHGLTFGIDLIYGLPHDNYETFCNSLDFVIQNAPNNIDIFPLSVLPGTDLSDNAKLFSLIDDGFPTYRTIQNDSFSNEDMSRAASLTESVNLLYNREQAFTWLNTVVSALNVKPSTFFESFTNYQSNNALDFVKTELRKNNQINSLPVIESFIKWSRAAESAFANPGREIKVKLHRKPEVLDELMQYSIEDFLKRHPSGRERVYKLFFDGEELFIN